MYSVGNVVGRLQFGLSKILSLESDWMHSVNIVMWYMTKLQFLVGNLIYWALICLIYTWLHSLRVLTVVHSLLYCSHLVRCQLCQGLVARLQAQITRTLLTHRFSVYRFVADQRENTTSSNYLTVVRARGCWELVLVVV
jgi:hypothetical protein